MESVPIRPMNMLAIRMIFPYSLSSGVQPNEKPHTEKAETDSKTRWRKEWLGSTIVSANMESMSMSADINTME